MTIRRPFRSFLLLIVVLGIIFGILLNKDKLREFVKPSRDFLFEMEKMRENMKTFQDITLDAMKRVKDKP